MRKRKLYVSELLKRNTNVLFKIVVIDNNITKDEEFKEDTILIYKDKEVDSWYINKIANVIVIKIK